MGDTVYYDGTKLLSMTDINGNKPEIYICTTNRTGGKTTYFNRLCVNRFLDGGGKFMLIYRFKHEIENVHEKFFKDINSLFFKGHVMTSKIRAKGLFAELFLDEKSCGYAVPLNSADQIKKYSHMFSDTSRMLFDEFQSETNHYCSDEISKFISVHTSVSRGQGKQIRYVPVYMVSNPVSIINPYYVNMGISNRLTDKVKFLRGDGFVLEQGYVDSAAREQRESGFNRAFKSSEYIAYAAEAVYLNDNKAFIEKPKGYEGKYAATIKYKNKEYGIRLYHHLGIVYCDDRPDITFPFKVSVTTDDHNINYVMLKNNDLFISQLRFNFERGAFRFKDLKCKEALMKCISY